ncbi:MAG: valine--tRNA ligase [bacterium]
MQNLSTTYNPQETENKIYTFWEENDCFKADASSDKPAYSMVIPPPNVTGVLHMGHALDGTMQDILIRYHRMMGYEALWLPGTDHAGIATQNVVEKKLRDEGLSRHDLGREKFIETVWTWANEHKSKILNQFKRLGASFDRSRERFTLDEGCSEAVKHVFVDLYNKGLIYKGQYTVNWCPRCHSAISDIETEYVTEQGHLWEISYPLKDEFGAIVIATTRPETMFGDVAIAVNPNDYRYKSFIGKTVSIPLSGKEIPIIADEAVEMDFGTGALKITPAHDPNDYEVGKRHGFEPVWIMDTEAKLIDRQDIPYDVRGYDRYEARAKIIELLKIRGQLIRTIPHEHNVGHCQRCSETIEPYLSEQWFVKMTPLAERPVNAIKTGELNFIPERWTKTYLDWMENIRDWCISRQLWWGHQIPAFYCDDCKEMMVSIERPSKCTKCSCTNITQDSDVLDTWFSSALWPFSTMGWPDFESADFKKFYPTSTLVTGFDIIFFWVARMVVMGYHFTDKSPFENVFIHGLVRDEHGQKMSKSKGNTIDPVEVIDQYGCDALRFTLTNLVTYGGQDIKVSNERFEFGRNFANKIWNASRFVLMNLEGVDQNPINFENLTIVDKWVLHKLNEASDLMNKNIKTFRPGEASSIIYEFFWNTYCDWYVELAKVQLQDENLKANTQRVLKYVLEKTLRLLHPVMPHITEEIWQILPADDLKDGLVSIMKADYPQFNESFVNVESDKAMDFIIEAVRNIRNARQTLNIAPSVRIKTFIYAQDSFEYATLEAAKPYLSTLAKIEEFNISNEECREIPPQSATAVVGSSKIIIPLAGLIDIEKETARQNKKLETLVKELNSLEGRMKNEKFVSNAPADVLEQTRSRIEEIKVQSTAINELLASLKG